MRHGSMIDPPNRFEAIQRQADLEQVEDDEEYLSQLQQRRIEYLPDATRSIVASNDSPDIPFRFSVNLYRGCAHGCSYCYARNTHEFLGMNAGLDFETRIMVKHDGPKLLREFLASDRWQPEPLMFSGVTDCYQPAEDRFELMRQCLEVALECHQPVGIITKNALVLRDIDLLQQLASRRLVNVFLSITTLDINLARDMEPRTSPPSARLRAVRSLSDAGVPVGVMVAPVIPGLNETEIPGILDAAASAGAKSSGWVLLRLPLTVEPVFQEWLLRTQPFKAEKVLGLIRQTRVGKMYDSQWGQRQLGSGPMAEQIQSVFQVFAKKYGLDQKLSPLDVSHFMPPLPQSGQMRLF